MKSARDNMCDLRSGLRVAAVFHCLSSSSIKAVESETCNSTEYCCSSATNTLKGSIRGISSSEYQAFLTKRLVLAETVLREVCRCVS